MKNTNKIQKVTVWNILIYVVLILLALLCVIPVIHILAVSFSGRAATVANKVGIWPVDFNIEAYRMMASKQAFWKSLRVSLCRIAIGVPLNVLLCILIAYPLSQSSRTFRARTAYSWFFVFTMFISGGLIPNYILIKELGLINTIWALVLPGAVGVYNSVLMMNFFRGVPVEMAESAFVDGADHFKILFKIYLPVSLPSLATITLFTFLGHWNSWFDGIIYMNNPDNYPLQSYLQIMINTLSYAQENSALLSDEEVMRIGMLSDESVNAAQIFLGALPVMLIYPFLQKYFVKGLTIGSVKG